MAIGRRRGLKCSCCLWRPSAAGLAQRGAVAESKFGRPAQTEMRPQDPHFARLFQTIGSYEVHKPDISRAHIFIYLYFTSSKPVYK